MVHKNMPDKLTAAALVHRLQPFGADAHLALAVSGGGDSMGLLALAAEAQKLDYAPRFSVLTVDHKLRPEAAAEAAQVAAVCRALGLPHTVLSADEKRSKTGIQQHARTLRYRLMAIWCAEHKAQALVVAHHQDDQAETVLMRMARGSGVKGLGGMAPRQKIHTDAGPLLLLRPFLTDAGDALKTVAAEAGLPINHDPSNDDTRFERVRWRRLLPKLEAEGLDAATLAELAANMRQAQAALDKKLTGWLEGYADWHEYGVLCLPRTPFEALPHAHQHRLLGRFVQYFGQHAHPLKRRKSERVLHNMTNTPHGGAVLGGTQVRWRSDVIFMGREAAACPSPLWLHDANGVWDKRFSFTSNGEVANLHLAALGQAGVQEMRNRGVVFDKKIPAVYLAALPGLFSGADLIDCPVLMKTPGNMTDFSISGVYSGSFYCDIFEQA